MTLRKCVNIQLAAREGDAQHMLASTQKQHDMKIIQSSCM